MLQTLQRPERDSRAIRATSAAPAAAANPAKALTERDDGLVAAAGPIMMAAYAVVLLVAVLTFKGNGEALLSVAVSIAFAIAFFGVPLAMMRTRARHDARWQKATKVDTDTVETYTGRIGRAEAVVHMVIVPVVVSVAFTCFAVIWVLLRP
jgi:mannose/fructose/N-acetylgalactosamine-specific phosphotransferase system component IIC